VGADAEQAAAPTPGLREPPLAGIHVLDVSRVLAGPYATMVLGDLGADVIKVERPGGGDDTRDWGPPFVGPEGRQESTYFLSTNRNKRSITLDLKDERDRELFDRMLVWADVLVENFRPGVMARLGLGPEDLKRLNPELIVLSITGFGSSGPDRDRVAYDQILQAEAGLMSVTGNPPDDLLRVGVPIADLTAGLFGIIGVLAALYERVRSGHGQRVETSLLAGQLAIHVFQGTRYLVAGEVPGPTGNHHPTVAPYGSFRAADGQIILAVGNEITWRRFADLLEIPGDRAPFAGNESRVTHRDELQALIEERLAARGVADWIKLFAEHGVPAGEVKTLDRVYAGEQVREQGLVIEVPHSTLGNISLPGRPLRFDGSPLRPATAPPVLGEHSDQLRRRFGAGSDEPSQDEAERSGRDRVLPRSGSDEGP
jgi:formyl-CoA transferase